MSEKFTCPRRAESGMHLSNSPFRGSGPDIDEWREDSGLINQKRGCSYCGSMHPEDFMDAVRDGVELSPTDKPYKIYVGRHMSTGKFYTQHLTPEHSNEFRELYEDGSMNVGYPGHFYATLYLPGLTPKE